MPLYEKKSALGLCHHGPVPGSNYLALKDGKTPLFPHLAPLHTKWLSYRRQIAVSNFTLGGIGSDALKKKTVSHHIIEKAIDDPPVGYTVITLVDGLGGELGAANIILKAKRDSQARWIIRPAHKTRIRIRAALVSGHGLSCLSSGRSFLGGVDAISAPMAKKYGRADN
jgi:hypothetical protein